MSERKQSKSYFARGFSRAAFAPVVAVRSIVARLKADAGEIIWTGIRIYETKTVQRLLTRKSDS